MHGGRGGVAEKRARRATRQIAVETLRAAAENSAAAAARAAAREIRGGSGAAQPHTADVAYAAHRVIGAVEGAVLAEVFARVLDQLFLGASVVSNFNNEKSKNEQKMKVTFHQTELVNGAGTHDQ